MSNHYPKKPVTHGEVKISEHVIRSIASAAALEVEGVQAIAPEKCSLFSCSKPISVRIDGDTISISLELILQAGYSLPNVAMQVQKTVKDQVQSMAGVIVSKVHVIAAGLSFD